MKVGAGSKPCPRDRIDALRRLDRFEAIPSDSGDESDPRHESRKLRGLPAVDLSLRLPRCGSIGFSWIGLLLDAAHVPTLIPIADPSIGIECGNRAHLDASGRPWSSVLADSQAL